MQGKLPAFIKPAVFLFGLPGEEGFHAFVAQVCQQVVEDDHRGIVFGQWPDASDDGRVAPGDGFEFLVFQGVLVNRVLFFVDCRGGLDSQADDDVLPGGQAPEESAVLVILLQVTSISSAAWTSGQLRT
jgi:hypothetical protein